MGFWRYFREALIALVGGFFGAVLGVVAVGSMKLAAAFFLMIIYGAVILAAVAFFDWIFKYKS